MMISLVAIAIAIDLKFSVEHHFGSHLWEPFFISINLTLTFKYQTIQLLEFNFLLLKWISEFSYLASSRFLCYL